MQCLHRWQKVLNPHLIKGSWTPEVRAQCMSVSGLHWARTARLRAQPGRCAVGCETATFKRGVRLTTTPAGVQEDEMILLLVEQHGPQRWSFIASQLPGRIGKQCRER